MKPARNPRKVAGPPPGPRVKPTILKDPAAKVSVSLDPVEWRAIAAMLYATTQSTASSPAHRTLFNRLYEEVCRQGSITITPLE